MKSLFVCQGNRVLHSLNEQELPLQLLEIKPLRKFNYGVFVELVDGTLAEVVRVLPNHQVVVIVESHSDECECYEVPVSLH